MAGTLVLVATPIGNLEDLSTRAVAALRSADCVCCEDTRRTGNLLRHLGIRAPRLIVINEHTEYDRTATVMTLLANGATVALVSDAGTPAISDPGERLVRAALDAGATVSAMPGPAALIMALVLSGLPTARFAFDGFLPRRGADRTRRLAEVAHEQRTVVLYEAPHRLERTLVDLVQACGPDRQVALARELTKIHEDVWRGTLGQAVQHSQSVAPRGEYVLVLEGAPAAAAPGDHDIDAELQVRLAAGLSVSQAAAEVAAALGLGKRTVYQRALTLRSDAREVPSTP
jgi:16S rRNA (cytidine1402-2'-O)-methyltransferase